MKLFSKTLNCALWIILIHGTVNGQNLAGQLRFQYEGSSNGLQWYGIYVDGNPVDLQDLTEISFKVKGGQTPDAIPKLTIDGWFNTASNVTLSLKFEGEDSSWAMAIRRPEGIYNPGSGRTGILGVIDNLDFRQSSPIELIGRKLDYTSHFHLELFPNPASNVVYLRKMGVCDWLALYGPSGQVIWQSEGNMLPEGDEIVLNLQEYPPGIYHIVTHKRGEMRSHRLLIQ